MIRSLVFVAAVYLAAASAVAASAPKVEAVFTNHSSEMYVLEILDAKGLVTGYTTLHPGQSDKFEVANGKARIRELNNDLSLGKQVSSCRIVVAHVTRSP
jgi:hypothetical protein